MSSEWQERLNQRRSPQHFTGGCAAGLRHIMPTHSIKSVSDASAADLLLGRPLGTWLLSVNTALVSFQPPSTRALLPLSHAVQTLGISGDPSGDNRNHQEASRKEQKLRRSLRDLLANHKTNGGRQALCLQLSFSRVLGCLGGCILGRCTGV